MFELPVTLHDLRATAAAPSPATSKVVPAMDSESSEKVESSKDSATFPSADPRIVIVHLRMVKCSIDGASDLREMALL